MALEQVNSLKRRRCERHVKKDLRNLDVKENCRDEFNIGKYKGNISLMRTYPGLQGMTPLDPTEFCLMDYHVAEVCIELREKDAKFKYVFSLSSSFLFYT